MIDVDLIDDERVSHSDVLEFVFLNQLADEV